MKKGLLALAFGGLSIGMTEFTMMGILPDIAGDIGVNIPVAAHLIALYALGVFVGAPVLVLFTSKYPPKKVLILLMLMFLCSMVFLPLPQITGVCSLPDLCPDYHTALSLV
jgi:DHA1 family arabinose polymer transporter-like MFS transporter